MARNAPPAPISPLPLYPQTCRGCHREYACASPPHGLGSYWCKPCAAERDERLGVFDPQPGDLVWRIGNEQPFAELLVRERDGDVVTAWPIGWEADAYLASGGCATWLVSDLVPCRKHREPQEAPDGD